MFNISSPNQTQKSSCSQRRDSGSHWGESAALGGGHLVLFLVLPQKSWVSSSASRLTCPISESEKRPVCAQLPRGSGLLHSFAEHLLQSLHPLPLERPSLVASISDSECRTEMSILACVSLKTCGEFALGCVPRVSLNTAGLSSVQLSWFLLSPAMHRIDYLALTDSDVIHFSFLFFF